MAEIMALVECDQEQKPRFIIEDAQDAIKSIHFHQQQTQHGLLLLRSMLALIGAIQRHRGATMALLGGDKRFEELLPKLQKEIALRIDLLMLEDDAAIPAVDKDNMLSAWRTIAHNWQDDAVLENFEFHSHLIEYLLRLVRMKGDQYIGSVNAMAGGHVGEQSILKNITQLNRLVCMSIPDCFELLAKLRGLATHAAACHQCDALTKSRIDFLLKELGRLATKLDCQVRDLDSDIQQQLAPGNLLAQAKVKRDYLTELLSNDIAEGKPVNLDSEMVYRVTSDVIDTYYRFSESIIRHLEAMHPKLLDHCLAGIK